MGFLIFFVVLALLNAYLFKKAQRFAARFGAAFQRSVLPFFLLMNAPFLLLMGWSFAGYQLYQLPAPVLRGFVYPFYAWIAMLLAFLLVGVPKDFLVTASRGAAWMARRTRDRIRKAQGRSGTAVEPETGLELALSRRAFLAGASATIPPLLYGISMKGIYGPHDLDISAEREILIPGLPRAFDGLRLTQISDLHVGAYIREREVSRVVAEANRLGADLIVMTGDTLDNTLDVLPVARAAVARLRAPLGVYGILGNHDYYADRSAPGFPGCMSVMEGMRQAGVRMLRDSRHEIVMGGERLLLAGVDWTGLERGNPNYYDSERTRRALDAAYRGADPEAVRILLAHHPHVFFESPSYNVALTLAGHTHGGGQVVIAEKNGRPIAIGSPLYKYMSGHYQEGRHHLYVNRGIGYVGLPIRLNCPPEISRFKLVRSA